MGSSWFMGNCAGEDPAHSRALTDPGLEPGTLQLYPSELIGRVDRFSDAPEGRVGVNFTDKPP